MADLERDARAAWWWSTVSRTFVQARQELRAELRADHERAAPASMVAARIVMARMAHRPREHGRITAAGDSDDAGCPVR